VIRGTRRAAVIEEGGRRPPSVFDRRVDRERLDSERLLIHMNVCSRRMNRYS